MLQTISNAIGMTADICILVITVFTLYLTVFSRKMSLVSHGASYGSFYGDKIHLALKNRSLHSIPIVKAFLLKQFDGEFYQIMLKDYGSDPLIVESWNIKKIETDPFSTILNWPSDDKRDWSRILKDAVVGIDVGDGTIWIKPYKNAPLRKAKKAYNNYSFHPLPVVRNVIDGVVVSGNVDYVIRVIVKDINQDTSSKTIFAIVGEKQTMFSDFIGRHNSISSKYCESPGSLKKYLCDTYKIPAESIDVERCPRKY